MMGRKARAPGLGLAMDTGRALASNATQNWTQMCTAPYSSMGCARAFTGMESEESCF